MLMVPFFKFAGDRALDEMRTITVMSGGSLPSGSYGFLELYCDEPGCDCRRVIFQVLRPESGKKIWATISFGWETAEYYRNWSRTPERAEEMASSILEPFGAQTKYSEEILRLFQEYLQADAAYVARLKRHYAEVKRMCDPKQRGRRRPKKR